MTKSKSKTKGLNQPHACKCEGKWNPFHGRREIKAYNPDCPIHWSDGLRQVEQAIEDKK